MGPIRRFWQNISGNLATSMGVLALPLITAVGVAVDYTRMVGIESALQEAADAAALAGAKELLISSSTEDQVREVAKQYALVSLSDYLPDARASNRLGLKTSVSDSGKNLSVELAYTWNPLIIQYAYKPALPVKVNASASLAGNEQICVIALDATSPGSFAMTGQSSITARGCAIYSNSKSKDGIRVVRGTTLRAAHTYSGGGYAGPSSSYKPRPVTDSPVLDDPLKDRKGPDSSNCDYKNLRFTEDKIRLTPGVYCGGIKIKKTAEIRLKPGVYVMKDGPLVVKGDSTLIGRNVGFYFTGRGANFDFGPSTQVKISAPKSGPLAGLLFFQDQNAPYGYVFSIRSRDAKKFEGTVYLPKGKFVVDNKSRVGQLSKWTAVVANQIEIMKGPELVIRADYSTSDIPVPEGIGPNGAIRLTR